MNIIEVDYKWNGELRRRSGTAFIVLHHAQAKTCTVEDIHRWHTEERGWKGIAYHFFCRKDGSIYRGRPIWAEGGHTQGFNDISIGICLEGHFDFEDVPETQKEAVIELLQALKKEYPGVRIARHKDLNNTACPGAHFPDEIILRGSEHMEPKHWAEDLWQYLNDNGIKINEKGFDDKITRGEVMALLKQVVEKINK